ncbi:MAG: hypothetical protein ACYC5O_24475 [Anaerolineae bacterium]
MPWVNVMVGKQVSAQAQEQVKAGLARTMGELMDKQEAGLVVTFTEAVGFYRGGAASPDAAVVDARWIGQFPLSVKQDLTKQVAALLASALGADPMKVIVLMTELSSENWGRKAGDFS